MQGLKENSPMHVTLPAPFPLTERERAGGWERIGTSYLCSLATPILPLVGAPPGFESLLKPHLASNTPLRPTSYTWCLSKSSLCSKCARRPCWLHRPSSPPRPRVMQRKHLQRYPSTKRTTYLSANPVSGSILVAMERPCQLPRWQRSLFVTASTLSKTAKTSVRPPWVPLLNNSRTSFMLASLLCYKPSLSSMTTRRLSWRKSSSTIEEKMLWPVTMLRSRQLPDVL